MRKLKSQCMDISSLVCPNSRNRNHIGNTLEQATTCTFEVADVGMTVSCTYWLNLCKYSDHNQGFYGYRHITEVHVLIELSLCT